MLLIRRRWGSKNIDSNSGLTVTTDVVNVIMLGDGQKQGPVSEYFFRLLWKEQDATLHVSKVTFISFAEISNWS